MVRKKIDNRIRVMIENGVHAGHRTLFLIVGDKSRDQVVILHHMLSKAAIKARPSVLWCYRSREDLGFKNHRDKRMKKIQQKVKTGSMSVNEDDPFEMFVASTNISYRYYHETHKILGNTFGMCVLQDFEALTPNLLARTVETVEGGGIIAILLRSVTSLKQLFTMTMDCHARYRTESHQDVVGRFNERFILSLSKCKNCLVMDDKLNVLPISSYTLSLEPLSQQQLKEERSVHEQELKDLKAEAKTDDTHVNLLVDRCRTLDQAKAVLKFIDAILDKTLRTTVSLTAARGRGKSAALGLAIAASVAFNYSNIFVTSPSPENLKTLFQFVFEGFDALGYEEHKDYDLVQSTNPDFNKAVVRINIYRNHRQTVQYIHPTDARMLGQAELVVIDEAAAIPLPLVKSLLGPYLVFLSSTVNGYEGTGRSLSLKLIDQLRRQASDAVEAAAKGKKESTLLSTGRVLYEITLNESIRYRPGDHIESWLTGLLCLDATRVPPLLSGCPPTTDCDLYYINRDTLFSYNGTAEKFLQRLMALYVASHYKNTPDDLQLMSDAPAHHLFCLLGPITEKRIPEILVVLQVCLEGAISKESAKNSLVRGKQAAGDLIPWTVSQQFQDEAFPALSGARVVRIATHPDYQSMGYGARALELLEMYYDMKIPNISENAVQTPQTIKRVNEDDVELLSESIGVRTSLPPLFLNLSERPPEPLDYLGVSYGLTEPLLRFWRKSGYTPVYLSHTANDLTGEYSCIMLKLLHTDSETPEWLNEFYADFKRRFIVLLGSEFREFPSKLALGVLRNKNVTVNASALSREQLEEHINKYERKRLEAYALERASYHLITDLVPRITELYYLDRLTIKEFSPLQASILLGMGLQRKKVDDLAQEFNIPAKQLLALFQRSVKNIVQSLQELDFKALESTVPEPETLSMEPLTETLDEELSFDPHSISEKSGQKRPLPDNSQNEQRRSAKKKKKAFKKK